MSTSSVPQRPPQPGLPLSPHLDRIPADGPPGHLPPNFDINAVSLPGEAGGRANGHHGHAEQNRQSGDFGRQRGSMGGMPHGNGLGGAMPVPLGGRAMQNVGRGFEGPRSPPNSKNTLHVPCKFFRQGTCQAGQACPFLHSEAVGICKYFQKGNCKFGMRCANEHITQDGRRVNKPVLNGQPPMNLGGRGMPMPVGPPSLLTLQHDTYAQPHMIPGIGPEDYMRPGSWKNPAGFDGAYTSHTGSAFGSPPTDGRLPMSPVHKGLSVMDVPLPASFDSQGVSHYAKAGPFASSVPARFGFDSSPPASSPRAIGESSVVRNLRSSAFGDDSDKSNMGSSPPATGQDNLATRRLMHSERFSSKMNPISMSLGTRVPIHRAAEEWDDNFAFEEDLLPDSLQDLLTPQEKMRRFSRHAEEEGSLSRRLSLTNLGTPMGDTVSNSSKVGSPSNASPGSRFGAFFSARQPSENRDSGSAFGHVGSPLRNSSLNLAAAAGGASPSLRSAKPTIQPNDISPFVSSPPRQASMSMISQQLQRTRLQSRTSETSIPGLGDAASAQQQQQQQHPGMTRVASTSSIASSTGNAAIPANSAHQGRFDRTVSSSSINREKIDEEQAVFTMDDEPAAMEQRKPNAFKRNSGGLWTVGKASPRLGPLGGQQKGSEAREGGPWNA